MAPNWRMEIPQWVILVAMFGIAIAAWPYAPERIPVHWNLRGEVDRFGGRFEGLILVPLIALILYLLLLAIPKFDPNRANYDSFRGAWIAIRSTLLVLLAVIHACIVSVAFGYPIEIAAVIPVAVGVMLVILGSLMGKIQPNWFVGIRTPWTLTSRASWNKTHRLGGRLFVLIGIAIAGCGFVRSAWMLGLALGIGLIAVVWMTVYSYFIWRDDPERQAASSLAPTTGKDPGQR